MNQSIDSSFSDGAAAPTGTSGGASKTFLSDPVAPGSSYASLDSVESAKDIVKVPTEVAQIKVSNDGREPIMPKDRVGQLSSEKNIQSVQKSNDSEDDMFTLLESGGLAMSAATIYRHYGKNRSVGSLEQRLREWTASGFALRGSDNGKDTHT